MPSQGLVDVRVIVGGRPLEEYLEPGTVDEGHTQSRYVEITAGQQFSVRFKWQAGFDLMWADGLYYKLLIDDSNLNHYRFTPKKDVTHDHGKLIVATVQNREDTSFKNEITGKWENCPFVFGAPGISESCVFRGCLKLMFKQLMTDLLI